MSNESLAVYILIAAATIYLIRMLPLTLIRRDIKNRFLRSFLHYVPYVTLSVMTVPAIFSATSSVYSGIAAFVVGVICALIKGNLFLVSFGCCLAVLVTEFFL